MVDTVESSYHFPANPARVGFSHPWNFTGSGDSGYLESHTEQDTGEKQAGLLQLPNKSARVNGGDSIFQIPIKGTKNEVESVR